MQQHETLKVVSLFSGCGGFDFGLQSAGMKVIWANDIEKSVAKTYEKNIGPIEIADITTIEANTIPEHDVFVAGFPCQPFSSIGSRLGILDARGTLYEDCLRIVEAKQPRAVIFENVRGILSTKNADGTLLLDSIVSLLENCGAGYDVQYKLMRASEYGVPQNRYRVIFVAFRKDLAIHYIFPKPTTSLDDPALTVGAIIDVPSHIPNQQDVRALPPQSMKMIPHIPEGGSWKDIPFEILPERLKKIRLNMKKYGTPSFYRRFARTEINGTITARANPENCGILHPLENRRYSVREVARLQSFPDDFIFDCESITATYAMLGNAVPPLLGKVIGESVIAALNGEYGSREKQLTFEF